MKKTCLSLFLLIPFIVIAQKKPLDHSVYDGWQSIGEKLISNDGKWVVFTVTPQEGDAVLWIKSTKGSDFQKAVPRGYNARITDDSRFVVFKIKPLYKETRDARIKKKRPDELPKDSVGILELGKDNLTKIARVKSYKVPEKAGGWLAILKEKETSLNKNTGTATQKTVDSLKHTIDSLTLLVSQIKNVKSGAADETDADDEPSASASTQEGSELVLRNLNNGKEKVFKNVSDFYFNAQGQELLLKSIGSAKEGAAKNAVVLYHLKNGVADTILKGGNDFRNFALTEDGIKIAFLAERDTNTKALQRFYGLYLYTSGCDSASLLVDKKTAGMNLGMTVSENGNLSFSKSGNRLFFGTAAIQPPKDTSIIDFEVAKLDIWNYKDDYLQTQQLFQLNNDLKRNYLAVYDFDENIVRQLGSKEFPVVVPTKDGDGDWFVAITDTGRRVESQWMGRTRKDIYAIDVKTGNKKLVQKNLQGQYYPSSTGKYILLYDAKSRSYSVWNGKNVNTVCKNIKVPLYDEDNDVPDDPSPYGIMGWGEGDSAVYVYDRYDIWKVDPSCEKVPLNIFGSFSGRKNKLTYRYIRLDTSERFIPSNQALLFKVFDNSSKKSSFKFLLPGDKVNLYGNEPVAFSFGIPVKAKNDHRMIYTKESYVASPDLYVSDDLKKDERLSAINEQQSNYNWGTSELYHWKTFDGKAATGILYKPENFDLSKKYPMLIYFYERLSDGLYNYQAPAPTPSRLNIPFFVSRGYLVFAPDISYTKGHPGKDAYNYIVSGAQALTKNPWVDAKNIGIQGQSWGGYQVAYLVTATNMFKAAWAGAPVVNMFSAYGGIRWESGNNRQFQYEKGQSRIGYTPWERPDLYIENSPFFHLKNIQTPLVIMSNDADGAVPWYQGIEFFTAMRRLNKKIWLLSYNGEAHNLVERRNRKDIQIREQQYFDWMLKGEKPAKWLTEGIPAVNKGKDWGLQLQY